MRCYGVHQIGAELEVLMLNGKRVKQCGGNVGLIADSGNSATTLQRASGHDQRHAMTGLRVGEIVGIHTVMVGHNHDKRTVPAGR